MNNRGIIGRALKNHTDMNIAARSFASAAYSNMRSNKTYRRTALGVVGTAAAYNTLMNRRGRSLDRTQGRPTGMYRY